MRALAPLPAFFLLAASAAACPFGPPGHVHPTLAQLASVSIPVPQGKCAGSGVPPLNGPSPLLGSAAYDFRPHPPTAEERKYWELLGYRFSDFSGRVTNPNGSVVTDADITALREPVDAAYERISPTLWAGFMFNGYRLRESDCRMIGPDAKPLDRITLKMWDAVNRRSQSFTAVETLLAKLHGLPANGPVPEKIRQDMLALSKAGTELPAKIKDLLARDKTTVAQLRAPTEASYTASTRDFDGERTLDDAAKSAVAGTGIGVVSRHKGIVDPDERILGQTLSAAFTAEIGKTAAGRELLSHFRGKGQIMPDVLVLKLAQRQSDLPVGAYYNPGTDGMVINHWEVARILLARLPRKKAEKLKNRLGDAKQLSALLKEDPTLLPLIVDDMDVTYFHELTHAAQSRRNRLDDELLRGNLPSVNPLSKEQEAHRSHCAYLFSKSAAAIARSEWRDYCLELLRDPDAFKDRVTSIYMSTFAGSSTLDDVAERQDVRRRTSFSLQNGSGFADWLKQLYKQAGYDLGDKELKTYRADVDQRDKAFLATIPAMRRDAGEALVSYYSAAGDADKALEIATKLPAGTLAGGEARLGAITDKAEAWVIKNKDSDNLNRRIAAVGLISARLTAAGKPWPAKLTAAYERDALAVAEESLAQALTPGVKPADKEHLLDIALAWSKVVKKPGTLPARIAKARGKKKT